MKTLKLYRTPAGPNPMLLPSIVAASLFAAPLVVAAPSATPSVVKDAGGKRVDLADKSKKAIVLVFVAHDCPISNAYAPEISRLAARYAAKRMPFYLVYPERGLAATEARRHTREYRLPLPILMDPSRRLVKKVQARVTPEVAVLAPSGKLLYRGRIDDRYAVLGKPRLRASQHDLRLALEAISANMPVKTARTVATGCYIEG